MHLHIARIVVMLNGVEDGLGERVEAIVVGLR
jgi:hypothetical protein